MKFKAMRTGAFALAMVCAGAAAFAQSANLRSTLQDNFVTVTGGTFTMGRNDGEADESPAHRVTVSSFSMMDTEVPQWMYAEVMGVKASSGGNIPKDATWNDAIAFCNKLSVLAGLEPCYTLNGTTNVGLWGSSSSTWNAVSCNFKANGYRLPTEAEWEYAARGGSRQDSYKYSGSNTLDDVAWNINNSKDKPHDVGLMKPNSLGLYDMTGNQYEWCWDWYGEYGTRAVSDPTGASEGTYRVYRGGSWHSNASYCTVFRRGCDRPQRVISNLGFRVVRSLSGGNSVSTSAGQSASFDFILEEGSSIKLITSDGATWTSSNSSVVRINKKGKAMAVSEGTVTLTSSTGKTLRVRVEEED